MDLFRQAARTFVRDHTGAFAALSVRKFASFWWFPATAGLTYPGSWLVVYRLFYLALLVGAALGAVVVWRRTDRGGRQRVVLLLAMLGSISVAQSLFYVDVRHRWAVEPLLGIFLAVAVSRWMPVVGRPADASP